MSRNLGTNLKQVSTAGFRMVVLDPISNEPMTTEDGKEVVLILAGEDSEQGIKAEADVARKQNEAIARAGRKWRWSVDSQRAAALDILVACTLGWENANYNGDDTFSPELVRALYKDEKWLFEQATAARLDRSNFSGTLPTT